MRLMEPRMSDPFLKAELQAMQKEGVTYQPTHYVFDINELIGFIEKREQENGELPPTPEGGSSA